MASRVSQVPPRQHHRCWHPRRSGKKQGTARLSGQVSCRVRTNHPDPPGPWERVTRPVLLVALILGNLFPQVPGVSTVVVAGLIAAVLVAYDVLRYLPSIHPLVYFVIPVFAVLASSAIFIHPSTAYGHEKFLKLITVTLVTAAAAGLLRDRTSVVTFARTWLIAGVILATFVGVTVTGTGRAGGFGHSPVWLARAIVSAVLIALWLWWTKTDKWWLLAPAIVISLLGVVATGSRGPLLGLIIGCIPLAVVGKRLRWARVSVLGGLLAAIGAALLFLPMFGANRVSASDDLRQLFWRITKSTIGQHPLGVGFGNWAQATDAPRSYLYPHNIFLEVTAELGIPVGIFLIVVTLGVLMMLLLRASAEPVALLVLTMLTAETVAVSVSGDINARTFFFLLTLGFLIVTRRQPVFAPDPSQNTPTQSEPHSQPSGAEVH